MNKSLLDGKRILIVDDEPDVLETLKDLLSACEVVKASSFDEDGPSNSPSCTKPASQHTCRRRVRAARTSIGPRERTNSRARSNSVS